MPRSYRRPLAAHTSDDRDFGNNCGGKGRSYELAPAFACIMSAFGQRGLQRLRGNGQKVRGGNLSFRTRFDLIWCCLIQTENLAHIKSVFVSERSLVGPKKTLTKPIIISTINFLSTMMWKTPQQLCFLFFFSNLFPYLHVRHKSLIIRTMCSASKKAKQSCSDLL